MASQDTDAVNSQTSLKTRYEDGGNACNSVFSTFSQQALEFATPKRRASKYRSRKDEIIARLLCRWWYILPDWPDPSYDYTNKLKEAKLKLVNIAEYESHEDVDFNGITKVYELPSYKGVFRGPGGKLYDLRNREKCPCYDYICTLSDRQIILMLQSAIINQIKCMILCNISESEIDPFVKELENVSQLTSLEEENFEALNYNEI